MFGDGLLRQRHSVEELDLGSRRIASPYFPFYSWHAPPARSAQALLSRRVNAFSTTLLELLRLTRNSNQKDKREISPQTPAKLTGCPKHI